MTKSTRRIIEKHYLSVNTQEFLINDGQEASNKYNKEQRILDDNINKDSSYLP